MVVLSLGAYAVLAGLSIAFIIASARAGSVRAGLLGIVLIALGVLGPSPVRVAIWSGVPREDKVALAVAGFLTLFGAAGLGWFLDRMGFVRWMANRLG